ncbi:MAG TPA: TVP38/TMEM64 family protein [Desulfobacterales bacterium]|nr:TVP38/TMEM64 family protein [Desulfobacterales bacterium]
MKKTTAIWLAAAAALLLLLGILASTPAVWAEARHWYGLVTDREWLRAAVESCGWAAPFVFIGIQVAQVIAAPIPGEATGFIGGYVFGTLTGFIYSTIGLTIGSLLNFGIGRMLGERFVRRLVSKERFQRIDRLINRQGIIALFIMFAIPGFPKDYLCLALGLSTLPLKLFALMACIGRMPGTLMLSLQGAALYDRSYGLLSVVAGACLVLVLLAYRYREALYRWVEKMNPARDDP